MMNFTRHALVGAIALAFAAAAAAQTSATTNATGAANGATPSTITPSGRNDNAMRGPSANANTPQECARLTGRQLGQCMKDYGGASGNGASASNPNEHGRWGMKNDRSTAGTSGGGNGMGTTGGANDTTQGGHIGASSSSASGAAK